MNAADNALMRSYVWGLDLSGTLDGAGGVGGLLWVTKHSTPQPATHFAAYDGNGNVPALVQAQDGTESARYEYGPFGEPLRLTGPMADANPFRFSTKRTDNTTDLVLYEYRPYSPSVGRWLSRDSVGQLGFELMRRLMRRVRSGDDNLYRLVGNSAAKLFDVLGLYEYEWEDNFRDAEKQAIQSSIGRVADRAKALIKQIEDNIKALSKCPCSAYQDLIRKLEGLKKVLEGMVREIDDPGWNLEIYRRSMPGVDASYWDSPVPWMDDRLTLNLTWFSESPSGQDSTMFYEISHGQGTDDGGANDYNNAHLIESLMHVDKENWIIFKKDKKDADKKCNRSGK
ncbi:MAG: hypothetical protein N2Z21_04235 [Candidatus Sumerlaeaceae bacterium]|nr:hypothetical protein [Candidatus Sumerlaeaceae bacterium]